MLTFFEKLSDIFQGKLHGFVLFLYGLIIGAAFFILVGMVVFIISRQKKVVKHLTKKDILPTNPEFKEVIKKEKQFYIENYKGTPAKEKLSGMGYVLVNLCQGISKLYYPESEDSMFEVTIDQLVDFLAYFTKRINYTIDTLLEGRLNIIDRFTKHTVKDTRLSTLIKEKPQEPVEEIKPKKQNKLIKWAKKKAVNVGVKVGLNILDDEFIKIIDDLGEDLNKLYTKQVLNFELLSRRDRKSQKKTLEALETIAKEINEEEENV